MTVTLLARAVIVLNLKLYLPVASKAVKSTIICYKEQLESLCRQLFENITSVLDAEPEKRGGFGASWQF